MSGRRRPRRGPAGNVLETGDTGIFAGPLGGDEPGATESGDLASREYGVPQADIPGGVRHLVNPQTRAARPVSKPPRHVDYHREHGVEPQDFGPYETPPDATEEKAKRPLPEPKIHDAIPVYVVQHPTDKRVRKGMTAELVTVVNNASAEPTRLCNIDHKRVMLHLLNEDATTGIRIGEEYATLLEGRGALLPPGGTSYQHFTHQGPLWAMTTSASATAKLSVIVETEVPDYA